MRISDWSSDVCSSDLATDGAASGTGLLDFGMHRAGPDGALGRIGCGRLAFYSIAIGIGLELREAACAAKIMMLAAVRRNVRRGGRVDRHAARSEERRGGKEGGSTCRSRGWAEN